MNTGNEVRRVLVNELGLTREYVRGMVDDIVRDIVAKRLDAVNIQRYIDKIILSEINELARDHGRISSADIRGYAQRAAQEKVAEFIKERLQIT